MDALIVFLLPLVGVILGCSIAMTQFAWHKSKKDKVAKLYENSIESVRATYPTVDIDVAVYPFMNAVDIYVDHRLIQGAYTTNREKISKVITNVIWTAHARYKLKEQLSQYTVYSQSYGFKTESIMTSVPGVKEVAKCPLCVYTDKVWDIVIHCNDEHRMARPEIADWLETLDIDLSFSERRE